MGWTTPKTINVGDTGTSSDWNTYVRDNTNDLDRRTTMKAGAVATSQATASTSYTDLATVGPSVTVTVGSSLLCLVLIGAKLENNASGNGAAMSVAFTGPNSSAAGDISAVSFVTAANNQSLQVSNAIVFTLGSAGSYTFTAKYRAITGGTASFTNRYLTAIPLSA